MENAIRELSETIQQVNMHFNWPSAISAICSVVSLLAIVVLLKERAEKNRPYLQVSLELIRGTLVCIVIRNVGVVPAVLKMVQYNESFAKQLSHDAQKRCLVGKEINVSIHPKQQWVLCLGETFSKVVDYKNKMLEVTYTYVPKGKQKKITEKEIICFDDYSIFLEYISEIDELRSEIKELIINLNNINKTLRTISKTNIESVQLEKCANIGEKCDRYVPRIKESEVPKDII